MATTTTFLLHLLFFFSVLHASSASRRLNDISNLLQYHNGPLLTGKISVNVIWYDNFKPSQKAIISDFITALSAPNSPKPSVATWWNTTHKYHISLSLRLAEQISNAKYSLGKSLTDEQLLKLASNFASENAINVVLTAADVAVSGFCSSRCGTHSSAFSNSETNGRRYRFAYIWVGNSEKQCPGQCAWPFHQPIYGPQSPPLVASNNDVGLDGMVINLASLLAGTATNPFGNGYYQGDASAPLEAASACSGVYGKGAYPGYPGDLLVDSIRLWGMGMIFARRYTRGPRGNHNEAAWSRVDSMCTSKAVEFSTFSHSAVGPTPPPPNGYMTVLHKKISKTPIFYKFFYKFTHFNTYSTHISSSSLQLL